MLAILGNNKLMTLATAVAALAATILPEPNGAGPVFRYGLASMGFFVGVIVANFLNLISPKTVVLYALLMICVAVTSGIIYIWMIYNVYTPRIHMLGIEALLYTIFFSVFFSLARLADLKTTK